MTLLIARLLIYHLGLSWWCYVLAAALWIARLGVYKSVLGDLEASRKSSV